MRVPKKNLPAAVGGLATNLGPPQDVHILAEVKDSEGIPVTDVEFDSNWLRRGAFGAEEWDIKAKAPRELRPGRYTLLVRFVSVNGTSTDVERDFLWGVLAINTPWRHFYTLSTADSTIIVNEECSLKAYTEVPDYEAHWALPRDPTGHQGEGEYGLTLSASFINKEGQAESHKIQDKFEVRSTVPFDVHRKGPTRIFPTSPYSMTLTVKANESFEGKIIEPIPSSFEIVSRGQFEKVGESNQGDNGLPSDGNTDVLQQDISRFNGIKAAHAQEITQEETVESGISQETPEITPEITQEESPVDSEEEASALQPSEISEDTQITWNVSFEAGGIYQATYLFDAPDISPYLWLLGPASFLDSKDDKIFEEIRQWQIAADVVLPSIYVAGNDQGNQGDGDESTIAVNQAGSICNTVVCADSIDYDADSTINDADWVSNGTSETTTTQGFQLNDMPADFGTMDTGLNIKVRYNKFDDGSSHDTVTLGAQIVQADGSTELAGNSGPQTIESHSSGCGTGGCGWTTDAAFTFTSVNTTANKATWDGAELELTWTYTKPQSPDDVEIRISAVELNGAYTAATFTVGGNVYEDEATTALVACDDATPNIAVSVNGGTPVTGTCADANGAFSIDTGAAAPAAGIPISVYIDGATCGGDNVNNSCATTAIRYSGSGNITDAIARRSRLVVRHDDATAVSNTNLGVWDNGNDADIVYTEPTAGNIEAENNIKLIVNSADTFTI